MHLLGDGGWPRRREDITANIADLVALGKHQECAIQGREALEQPIAARGPGAVWLAGRQEKLLAVGRGHIVLNEDVVGDDSAVRRVRRDEVPLAAHGVREPVVEAHF